MATTISTSVLITDIMGDEALNFYGSTHPHAVAIKEMIKDTNGDINLENSLVQGMLALLIADGVLTTAVSNRLNAEIARQALVHKVYTPQELKDIIFADSAFTEWVSSGNDLLISNELNSRGINVNHLDIAYALRGI